MNEGSNLGVVAPFYGVELESTYRADNQHRIGRLQAPGYGSHLLDAAI